MFNQKIMKTLKSLLLSVLCFTFCESHAQMFDKEIPAYHQLIEPADTVTKSPANQSSAEGPVLIVEVDAKHVNLFRCYSDGVGSDQRAVFPKGSTLTIFSKTEALKEVYITIDEATEQHYQEPVKLIAKGRHTIKIRALNVSGNETLVTVNYLVIE